MHTWTLGTSGPSASTRLRPEDHIARNTLSRSLHDLGLAASFTDTRLDPADVGNMCLFIGGALTVAVREMRLWRTGRES